MTDQLAGKSEGLSPGNGFSGGPGGAGLGRTFRRSFLQVLDADKDSSVTQAEFTEGFARLFQAWNSDKSGALSLEQLRLGIDKDLPVSREGFPPFGANPRGDRRPPSNEPDRRPNPQPPSPDRQR